MEDDNSIIDELRKAFKDIGTPEMSVTNDIGEEFNKRYDEAVAIVTQLQQASTSYIQRRLRIAYNTAASIMEKMEAEGIVGPAQGSRPREVIVKKEGGVSEYFTTSQYLFKKKEYSQAIELVEKAINITPDRKELGELKKQILLHINLEYRLGGLIGGLITVILFRLLWAHNASFWGNTWWDTLKISLFLFMGLMIGDKVGTIFVNKASTKIKKSRERVFYPFMVGILTTTVLVVSWNLAIERFWSKSPEIKVQEQNEHGEPVKKIRRKGS